MHVLLDHESLTTAGLSVGPLSSSHSPKHAEELIHQISRLIKRETNLGVQEMAVNFSEGKMVLTGYCRTFYTKQLAQEAALKLLGDIELVNDIRVA